VGLELGGVLVGEEDAPGKEEAVLQRVAAGAGLGVVGLGPAAPAGIRMHGHLLGK